MVSDLDERCAECGGRAAACRRLGHRAPEHRGILWHPDDVALQASSASALVALAVKCMNEVVEEEGPRVVMGPKVLGRFAAALAGQERDGATPRVDALMAQWSDDGATRGAAFIELRDLAREMERLADSEGSRAVEYLRRARKAEKAGAVAGFDRDMLSDLADGLDCYEKTVNVGAAIEPGMDMHLESTTAAAARFIRAFLAAPSAAIAAREQEAPTWRHVANEWADMATNAVQHIRNIRDGITKPEDGLANLADCLKHCEAVQEQAKRFASREEAPAPQLTAAPQARPWPKTATPEMVAAFKHRFKEGSFFKQRLEGAIEAMLDAAPAPSPQAETVEALSRLRDLGNKEVHALVPMGGNHSIDARAFYAGGFRRCADHLLKCALTAAQPVDDKGAGS